METLKIIVTTDQVDVLENILLDYAREMGQVLAQPDGEDFPPMDRQFFHERLVFVLGLLGQIFTCKSTILQAKDEPFQPPFA
jgi:hypothetical protein